MTHSSDPNRITVGIPEAGDDRFEQIEKNRVTLVSLAAAILLTLIKLLVGILSGSLGMISIAADSGLDVVSTIITFFSVRIAGWPANLRQPYGYGRVENLSAAVQGVLLLGTAAFILREAVNRIFFETVPIVANVWMFVVMGGSVLVDYWRSRMLLRAAQRYHSSTLEADALNFRTDMLSSLVVIGGLACVAYTDLTGQAPFLVKADAVAGLVVGGVILVMSGRLAVRAVSVLLDRSSQALAARLTGAVAAVPGVVESEPVRVRESGKWLLADVTVRVPRTASLAEAHAVTERVEAALRTVDPRTATLVHVEPAISEHETAIQAIRAVALRMGIAIHHERVYDVGDHREATLHLEVPPEMPLRQAHELAHALVDAVEADNPRIRRVHTHIEVAEPLEGRRVDISAEHPEAVADIKRMVLAANVGAVCNEVRLYRADTAEPRDVVLHCDFPAATPMAQIHERTELIELLLRERWPELEYVVVHAEPGPKPPAAGGAAPAAGPDLTRP